jgi:hypothetical protein
MEEVIISTGYTGVIATGNAVSVFAGAFVPVV